jgi:uncharacterized protein YajQ (UPF0234 family)
MSKYKFLDKHLEKTGKKVKTKVKKDKTKLSEKQRDDLIDKMLQDFGYID